MTDTHRQTDASDLIICPMLCYSNGTDKNVVTCFWGHSVDAAVTRTAVPVTLVTLIQNQHLCRRTPESLEALSTEAESFLLYKYS